MEKGFACILTPGHDPAAKDLRVVYEIEFVRALTSADELSDRQGIWAGCALLPWFQGTGVYREWCPCHPERGWSRFVLVEDPTTGDATEYRL